MPQNPHERIALLGVTGVGKSELAAFLGTAYGFQVCRTGALCREVTKLIYQDDSKARLMAVSDVLKALDPAVFLNAALRNIDPSNPHVIDSLRYVVDVEYAKRNGFRLVRIVADDESRRKWLFDRGQKFDFATDGNHSSERELADVDVDAEIRNSGSIEDLRQSFLAAIQKRA